MPSSVRGPRTAPASHGALDSFFQITRRGSTVGREIRGGLATFFTMAYIVVLNPIIIGTQADSTGTFLGGGKTPNLAMVAACTALVAGVMTLLMGVVANYPLALATGLGLNAFLAFGVAKLPGMTWPDAMGLIVIEGIIIMLLVLTGFRQAVFRAVPTQLKTAISVGIGLFITVIGLVDAGFVRTPAGPRPRSSSASAATSTAGRCWSSSSACWPSSSCWSRGPRRDPLRHRRRNHPRHGHRGPRHTSAAAPVARQDVEPKRMAAERTEADRATLYRRPRLRLLGHFSLLGSFEQDRHRLGAACSSSRSCSPTLRHDGRPWSTVGRGRLLDEDREPAERPAPAHRRLGRRGGG